MKRHYKLVFFFIFYSLLGLGQSIQIQVQDQQGYGISYSQILLANKEDSTSKKVYYTDKEGKALVQINSKTTLTVSAFGYKTQNDTLSPEKIENNTYIIRLTEDIILLDEIVLTAQIDETKAENAIQNIKIISEDQIFAQGAVSLKDVLVTQQNTRLSQDPVLGTSMSLMGISGQNVKILVDGIPIIGRQNGNIDLSQINLNSVERIEIIEGPLSVNYGSDALAGTINIITKKYQKEDKKLGFKTYYETVGQYNLSANAAFSGKYSSISIEGGRNFFQGWSQIDTSRYKEWKPKEQYFATLNVVNTFKIGEFRWKGNFFNELILNRGIPREPFYIQAFDDKYTTQRLDNAILFTKKLKNRARIEAMAAYNFFLRNKNTFSIDLTNLESTLASDASLQDTSGFDLWMSRGSYNLAKDSTKIKYQIGYDINKESAIGRRIAEQKQTMLDLAAFGSLEWKLNKKWVIKPGLRLAYNSGYQAPLVPSLHLKWANEKYLWRASYARGFRAPSIKDLYFNFVDINHNIQGNSSLEAEYSNNYQTSIERKIYAKNKKEIKLKLGAFYNDIDNLISLAQVPNSSSYTYKNIEIYKTIGVQNSNTLQLKHTQITLGYSYIGRYNQVAKSKPVAKFSYYPEINLNATHTFEKAKIKASFFGKYQGKMPSIFLDANDEIYTGFISAYTYADASLSRSFFTNKLQMAIGVKNIFGVTSVNSSTESSAHSSSSSSTPVSYGRSAFVSLSYHWSK